jgi:protein-disulfide isomerase
MLTALKSIEGKIGNLAKAAPAAAPSRPTIDYNKVHNLPIGSSPIKGDKNAPVTIVEFSDFQCPYCSRLQPTLVQVLEAYPKDVKLVFKDFPLSFHKQAKNAAKAARAAGEQGKYWEMHDLIFEKFSTVNEEMFKEFAGKLTLDMNKFNADYSSTKYDQLIQQDINMGRTAGVTGTPSLFLNGKRMQRRSLDDFKAAIDAIIKKK